MSQTLVAILAIIISNQCYDNVCNIQKNVELDHTN